MVSQGPGETPRGLFEPQVQIVRLEQAAAEATHEAGEAMTALLRGLAVLEAEYR